MDDQMRQIIKDNYDLSYNEIANVLRTHGIIRTAEGVRNYCKNNRDIFPPKRNSAQSRGSVSYTDDGVKTVLCLADVHLEHGTPTSNAYNLVKQFAKATDIDEVVLMGDFLECGPISKFDKHKPRLREGKRLRKDFETARKEIDFWNGIANDKVTYLEGNHENRIQAYLDENPEVEGLIEIQDKLKLEEKGVEWIDYNLEYQLYDSDMYLTHGAYHNKYHTQKHFEYYGRNIAVGHLHSFQSTSRVMRGQSPYISYGIGCLCDVNPNYLRNAPSQYIQGFAVCYIDTSTNGFTFLPVPITNDQFLFNGKLWKYKEL